MLHIHTYIYNHMGKWQNFLFLICLSTAYIGLLLAKCVKLWRLLSINDRLALKDFMTARQTGKFSKVTSESDFKKDEKIWWNPIEIGLYLLY